MTEIGTFHGFVDRGDPENHDFELSDLSQDSNFHDLDLSAIVPVGAKAVSLVVSIRGNAANLVVGLRRKGCSNYVNMFWSYTQAAQVSLQFIGVLGLSADRKMQYVAYGPGFNILMISVLGWWI